MTMTFIKAGAGINVDHDFTRIMALTPIYDITPTHKPRIVTGWIGGNLLHPCGFMRHDKVRVIVDKSYLVTE